MSKAKNGVEPMSELQQIMNLIGQVKTSIIKLKIHKGNSYYKKRYDSSIKELNKAKIYFLARLKELKKPGLKKNL